GCCITASLSRHRYARRRRARHTRAPAAWRSLSYRVKFLPPCADAGREEGVGCLLDRLAELRQTAPLEPVARIRNEPVEKPPGASIVDKMVREEADRLFERAHRPARLQLLAKRIENAPPAPEVRLALPAQDIDLRADMLQSFERFACNAD